MSEPPTSYRHVFREDAHGNLVFVGDFEGLYQSVEDPWQQSGNDGPAPTRRYYEHARARLVASLRVRCNRKILRGLEIGCGHGHVVHCLAAERDQFWDGMDISNTAIKKARELYPQYTFFEGNIMSEDFSVLRHYDVVILGQLLWYVFHKMDVVIANCHRLLSHGGLLIISQAFLAGPQRYGRQYADGFEGTVQMLLKYRRQFQLLEARYDDGLGLEHHDGLLVLRKV